MIPHRWRRSPADNGSADPNADVRPQRPANSILGAIRGLMASGAASRDDAIGKLVASQGASNVYSVNTNEGLIDIATGINGVPAAITTPFALRLSFDTTLAGSATNVAHLKVDGFDCGPILRRDGSTLADGDLQKGVPVLLLGEMAAPTDTKVTQVRVLDLTPSDVGVALEGRFKLTKFTGAARVALQNGAYTTLPITGASTPDFTVNADGSVTVITPGLYNVALAMVAGTSVTGPSASSVGVQILLNGAVEALGSTPYQARDAGIYEIFVKADEYITLAAGDVIFAQGAVATGTFGNANAETYALKFAKLS